MIARLFNAPNSELERFEAHTIEEIRRHIAENWLPILEAGDRVTIEAD